MPFRHCTLRFVPLRFLLDFVFLSELFSSVSCHVRFCSPSHIDRLPVTQSCLSVLFLLLQKQSREEAGVAVQSMWDDLSFSRKILFVVVLAGLTAVNIYFFVSNVKTLENAEAHPLSQLSIQRRDPLPPFALLVLIPDETPIQYRLTPQAVECETFVRAVIS